MEALNNLEIIEDYLDGNLNESQKKSFESRLISDADFNKEFNVIRDIRNTIILNGDQNLKEKIRLTNDVLNKENFFNNNTKTITMQNKNFTKWIAGLAAIFVLALAVVFLLPSKGNIDEMLAADLKPNEQLTLLALDKLEAQGFASSESTRKDSLINAIKLYSSFKYEESKSILFNYVQFYPEDHTAQFYLSLNYLNLTEYGKASEILTKLSKITDFEFREHALWNLVVCFLASKTDEGNAAAKRILEEIVLDKKGVYYKSAKGYLNIL